MKQTKNTSLKILVILLSAVLFTAFVDNGDPIVVQPGHSKSEVIDLKSEALKVLQNKCNICHIRNNPRKVFTSANISELAPKIYKQVFVKKRMPKGNQIRLTTEEYNTLKKWLLTMQNFNHGNHN